MRSRLFARDDDSGWRRALSQFAPEAPRLRARYDSGEFIFLPADAGEGRPSETYGDAIVPRSFLERAWAPWFKIHEVKEATGVLWQSMVTAQKLWNARRTVSAVDTTPSPSRRVTRDSDEVVLALAQATSHLARAVSLLAEQLGSNRVAPDILPLVEESGSAQGSHIAPKEMPPLPTPVQSRVQEVTRQPISLISRMPGHYYVDIGNVCNLRCPFCPTGNGQTRSKQGLMSVAGFYVVMEKIRPHARLVSLYNWGEPFLHPNLFEIITCAASTAHVHIDSNLSSRDFSPSFALELVNSGLTSLFGSIDGVTQEVYEKYRVKGDVERVFRKLAAIQDAKAKVGSQTPHLGWLYHVSRFNQDEMGLAGERAQKMNIPIVYKRLSSPDPAWWSSFHFDSEMVLKGAEWFNQVYAPPRNPDIDLARLHKNVRDPCRQLYETMTIQWNGDVMPCTCVEGPDYSMGNVIRDSLEDVWNGIAFLKSRQFITNYGPVQGTGSVCETLKCPVAQKHVR